jgi:hypothetical protein
MITGGMASMAEKLYTQAEVDKLIGKALKEYRLKLAKENKQTKNEKGIG